MFAIVLEGTNAEGEPFSTQVSATYATRRQAKTAGQKLIQAPAGLGKVATSFNVVEIPGIASRQTAPTGADAAVFRYEE